MHAKVLAGSDFVPVNALSEISGARLRLADQTPANSTFFAPLTSSKDAVWGAGTLTGTLLGTTNIAGGFLVCNATGEGIRFSALLNADFSEKGCIELEIKPLYSGTPSETAYVLSLEGSSGNGLRLEHGGAGLRLRRFNAASGDLGYANFGAWSPVSGTTYKIRLNMNFDDGVTALFIDNVQLGSTSTTTFTRGQGVLDFYLGNTQDFSLGLTPQMSYRNVVVYSLPQSGSQTTPPSMRYSTTPAPALAANAVTTDDLANFTVVSFTEGSDTVRFSIVIDGVEKYYTGTAWATANGSSQYNTIAEINAAAETLSLASGTVIGIKAYLIAATGETRPILYALVFEYDFSPAGAPVPDECLVYGWINDGLGDPINGATMTLELREAFEQDATTIGPCVLTTSTNSSGYFEISLVKSVTAGVSYFYTISYEQAGSTQAITGSFVVPDEDTVNFTTL